MSINVKEIRDSIIQLSKVTQLNQEEHFAKNRCQKILLDCINVLYGQLRPGNSNQQIDVEQYLELLNQKINKCLDDIEFRKEEDNKYYQKDFLAVKEIHNHSKDFIYNLFINQNDDFPFVPLLKEKPFGATKLDNNILLAQQNPIQFFTNIQQEQSQNIYQSFSFQNPYKEEIEICPLIDLYTILNFSYQSKYRKLVYISEPQQLQELIHIFTQALYLAIDLEHNSNWSYQGITCLIQISDENTDYILDPFLLRENLQILNYVFCSPKILKIFHGSNQDILWLQRDLGIYVVNMIDTYQLAKQFRKNNSLANLLSSYLDVQLDKTYQTCDWTQRPLSPEQIEYASNDTKYLLPLLQSLLKEFVYVNKNDQQKLNENWTQINLNCKQISLQVYQKPKIFDGNYLKKIQLLQGFHSAQDLSLFTKYWEIREQLARNLNEGSQSLISDQNLIYFFEQKNQIKIAKEKLEKENQTNLYLLELLYKEHECFYEQHQEHQYIKSSVKSFQGMPLKAVQQTQNLNEINLDLKNAGNPFHQYYQQQLQPLEIQIEIKRPVKEKFQSTKRLSDFLDYSQIQQEPQENQGQLQTQQEIILNTIQNQNAQQELLNYNESEILSNLHELNISEKLKQKLLQNLHNQTKEKEAHGNVELTPKQIENFEKSQKQKEKIASNLLSQKAQQTHKQIKSNKKLKKGSNVTKLF